MPSESKFFNYLKAGYPCLWVETHEEARCINELRNQATMYDTYEWDIIQGFKDHQKDTNKPLLDPISPFDEIKKLPQASVIFMKDFHKYIAGVEVYRTVKNILDHLKTNYKHIIFVGPEINIPIELEKDITVFEFGLPSVDLLIAVAERMVEENELDITIDHNDIAAGKGLTLNEAENAIAHSIITTGGIDRKIIEDAKLQSVKKSGLMELYMPEPESNLGGLQCLKEYLHSRKIGFTDENLPTPKGILLTGLPGSGKSLTAKVTASVFGFPLLKLDISSLKGSLVGESERKMKQATQLADAIGECVIWVNKLMLRINSVNCWKPLRAFEATV